jgi:MFS family permease
MTTPRVLPWLIGGQIGVHSAMAGVRLAAPLQALHDGYSPFWVGALLALYAAAPVLVVMRAGQLADRHGYHRPVQLSIVLAVLGALIAMASCRIAAPWRFLGLGVSAVLVGSAANISLIAIQRTAGAAATDANQRVKVFSWLGLAPPLSNVVGPVVVGLLIDHAGFAAAYAVMALLPLGTWFCGRHIPRQKVQAGVPNPAHARAWDLLALPGMRRLMAVNWLFSSAWDVHAFAVPVLAHERGFSASAIGLVLGLFTFSVAVVRAGVPLVSRHLQPEPMLVGALVATGLMMLLYPLAQTPWQMGLCAVALGLALGSVQPMVMATLHDLTPDERHGQAIALRSLVMNLSGTAMPLMFGVAGAALGAAPLFWLFGGLLAVCAPVARGMKPRG